MAVSGGLGQQQLREDAEIRALIRQQAASSNLLFSVCTGALLCAAGVLKGRQATTHWAAHHLSPYYGAQATEARVVVDGNYISCAGVTAGPDGALLVASLLRGPSLAESIQLEIEYAPDPLFHSGTPETASQEVREKFFAHYAPVNAKREAAAQRFAHTAD